MTFPWECVNVRHCFAAHYRIVELLFWRKMRKNGIKHSTMGIVLTISCFGMEEIRININNLIVEQALRINMREVLEVSCG